MNNLAEKFKELRTEKGVTCKEISTALGLSRNAYTNYEAGIREPSLETFKKICQYFNVSADYLLGL